MELIFRPGVDGSWGDCRLCREPDWSRPEAEEAAADLFEAGVRVIDIEALGEQAGRMGLLLDALAYGDTADLELLIEARRLLGRMLHELGPGEPSSATS